MIDELRRRRIELPPTATHERAIDALGRERQIDDALIASVAPLGWNHINLTGDYRW